MRRSLIWTLTLSSVLFSLSVLSGYRLAPHMPSDGLMESLKDVLEPLLALPPLYLALFILVNNAVKSLAVILLGLALGIAPFIFVVGNGVVLGLVLYEAEAVEGLGFAMAALLPHGVVEVPAIIVAVALGFEVGAEAWRRLTGGESHVRERMKQGIRVFTTFILPALIAASLIEVFVTPIVVQTVAGAAP